MKELDPLVKDFLGWIKSEHGSHIAKLFIDAYSSNDEHIDSAELEEMVSFLTQNSIIASAVLASPGGSIISELLYAQKGGTPIDQYFYASRGGRAVKGRLEAMERYLPVAAEVCLKRKGEVVIGSLGSGPGRYIINTVSRLLNQGVSREKVRAFCYDLDENACWRGRRLAAMSGVNDLVSFRRADMSTVAKHKKGTLDILILKGILCPYEAPGCRMVLEHVKSMLKPGGIIIASNVSRAMVEGDPFTCFIMNKIVNWVMQYKTEEELRNIFEASGLIWKGSFADELEYHIMGIGEIA